MKKKRIGLDIDDTICNTHFILMKYAFKYNKEHGNKPLLKYNTNNFGEVFGWSAEEVNDFFNEGNYFKNYSLFFFYHYLLVLHPVS